MKAKKIAALGLSLMMTMSLCGDVLAADIPVQEEPATISVEDIAGETEDEEITFAESADEGTGENVGDTETDEEIAIESEDREESVEDAFSSEENTAALEGEDIEAYRELDGDNGDEIFSWHETEDGTVTITAYWGEENVVTIPSELKGHAVTTLDGIFSNSAGSAVTEIIIPDSVQTIKGSFMSCQNLTKITLGRGVTSIDKYTFFECPKLKNVIVSMRKSILEYGGEVRFDSCMTDLDVRDGILAGIWVNQTEYIACETLVLATGHSARDTFAMLGKHIHMEPKSFAVGVRIEHPQEMINFSQYGAAHVSSLGAASYKLTHQAENGRGVFSFCMCPGGFVVNASSEKGGLAVNGMSYHARDSKNANSALIVTVTPQDFPDASYMGGVAFQRRLEQAAYRAGNSKIPLQLFGDFKEGRISTGLGEVKPCTKGAYAFADLNQVLPKPLTEALCEAIPAFDRKIHGFAREDALLLGVESRTSSPLRMVRDENGESNVRGLYPCGEGAGYAGGITSAAMDGIRAAEWIAARFCP